MRMPACLWFFVHRDESSNPFEVQEFHAGPCDCVWCWGEQYEENGTRVRAEYVFQWFHHRGVVGGKNSIPGYSIQSPVIRLNPRSPKNEEI